VGSKKMGVISSLWSLLKSAAMLSGLALLYPLWRLFVWMVNTVGVNGIRTVDGKLETPAIFYEHPVTKRRVVFVAVIHMAEQEYYRKLQQLIDSLPGYTVLFERVEKLSAEEEAGLTKKERAVAGGCSLLFKYLERVCDVMGLQHQKKGLSYDPAWINTDLRMSQLIKAFAEHDLFLIKKEEQAALAAVDLSRDKSAQLFLRWIINKLFSQLPAFSVLFKALASFSKKKRLTEALILDVRNEVAVRGIKKHLANGHVVTIWGAAHLRGIEEELKVAGFQEVSRQWFTAYHTRDYSFLECVGIRKSGA